MTPPNNKYLSFLRVRYELIGAITREREFSTANNLLDIREERSDGQKVQDDSNGAKLKGLAKDIKAIDNCLIIRAKNTVSWPTVRGTTVTGTVLAATDFCGFLCARYDANPPNLQKNVTAALCTSMHVTDLSAATEALSSHVSTKCVTRSCTLLNEPSPLLAHASNPSSTRDAEDQRRRHIRGGAAWRQELTFSSEAYSKFKLTPPSTSDLAILTRITTSISQWIGS